MRISTSMIYQQGLQAMQDQTSQLLTIQQQLSSGSRVLTPSDDPSAAAEAVSVSQASAINTQYGANDGAVKNALSQEDSILGNVTNTIQSVMSQIVAAGDPTLSTGGRNAIASQLQASYSQLLSLANSQDGNGKYLFSGYQGNTAPFVDQPGGAVYVGDQGQRMVQVSANLQLATSDIGSDIFARVQGGAAGDVISASPNNTGTATFSQVSVTNAADPAANDKFQLSFTVDNTTTPPTTHYTVQDLTNTANAPVTGVYTAGQAISFGGKQVSISGTPANADSFTIAPAAGAGGGSSAVTANSANTGSATYGPLSVTNPADPAIGDKFQISFAVNPLTSATTYTVQDLTNTAATPVTGTYTAGQPIAFGGQQLSFSGSPANGDSFNVTPSTPVSTNVFVALSGLIQTLKNAGDGPGAQASLTNALATYNQQFSNALNNVLTVRASVGARIDQVNTLSSQSSSNNLQYQTQLSNLMDVDWNSAVTKFSQTQAALQGAQKTFLQIQQLSLFSLIQ